MIKKFFLSSDWVIKSEARISLNWIHDLPHFCQEGNLMPGFVGYVCHFVTCLLFSFRIKINGKTMEYLQFYLKNSTVRCESRVKLFDIVCFFRGGDFLTIIKMTNWIWKFENWKSKRWDATVLNNPWGGCNPIPDLSVLIFFFHFSIHSM